MGSLGRQFRTWILAHHVAGVQPLAADDDHIRVRLPGVIAEVNFYPFSDEQEIVEYRIVRDDGDATFFLHFDLTDLERAKDLFNQMEEALHDEATREPMHVLLTCTSALTSSMFAHKMNDVADALGLDYDFCAKSVDQALCTTEKFAAVLLAPQVAYLRKHMIQAHPNALVFEIPAKIFGGYDAAGALRLLMHALREVSEEADAYSSLRAARDLHDDKNVLVITLFSLRDHTRLGYRLYNKGNPFLEGAVRKPKLDYRDIENLVEAVLARDVDIATLDAIGIAVPGVAYKGMVSLPGILEGDFDVGEALSRRFGLPVYVDNNCNAAAVGCYVSQTECENIMFYRHAFGHIAGGMGTVIDGKLLKGRGNLAGEPKYFESYYNYDTSYEDLLWSAEGMQQLAVNVAVTCAAIVAPEAIYLAVDTVDDAELMHQALVRILGEANAPQVYIISDYVERVYLGTLAMALQKLHDPKYRSLGVG